MLNRIAYAALGAAILIAGCQSGSPDQSAANTSTTGTTGPAASSPPAGSPTKASTDTGNATGYAGVSPILTANCLPCHAAGRPKAGIDVTTYATLMKGGREGAVIIAGDPDKSVLVLAIEGKPGAKKMPPRSTLAQADIDKITSWIKDGAKEK